MLASFWLDGYCRRDLILQRTRWIAELLQLSISGRAVRVKPQINLDALIAVLQNRQI